MVSTPMPLSVLLYPCRVPLSFLLNPCPVSLPFLLYPCHPRSEATKNLLSSSGSCEKQISLARLSFRGAKRRGICCFSFGLLRISRFARNDNNKGSLRIRLSASSVRY